MRKTVVRVSTIIAAAAAFEVVCIEFGIGIPLLSASLARVILAMSYAFVASWLFYILVVVIPDAWGNRYRSVVVARRFYHLHYSIAGLFDELSRKSGIRPIERREQLKAALDRIDDQIESDFQQLMIDHIRSLVRQAQSFAVYIDPRQLQRLDRVDLAIMTLDFGTRIEGETLGDSMTASLWRLRQLNEDIRESNAKLFDRVANELKELRDE